VVVAPASDLSGAGASIGKLHADWHIDAQPVELPGCDGVEAYAIEGPPGLCVLAARLGAFGTAPELVVSGINPGCNTGRAVLHSGTVGAALTAANFGVSGLAVSIDVAALLLHEAPGGSRVPVRDGEEVSAEVVAGPEDEMTGATHDGADAAAAGADRVDRRAEWQTAATVAASLVDWVLAAPPCTVLNVNVPNLPLDGLAGIRAGDLAPFGTVRTAVTEAPRDTSRLQLELRPTTDAMPPGSDTGLVAQGYVSLTALRGVGADPGVDLTEALATVPGAGVT
jgi:5'-nucleotidase